MSFLNVLSQGGIASDQVSWHREGVLRDRKHFLYSVARCGFLPGVRIAQQLGRADNFLCRLNRLISLSEPWVFVVSLVKEKQ